MVRLDTLGNKSSPSVMKLWMPMEKASEGFYNGILSDTSIDRDNEKMSPELLKKWVKTNFNGIPTLINHKNEMQSLAGGWKNLRIIENGDNLAIAGTFHALKTNPHTKWVAPVIEEMDKLGLPVGVSISAIPKDFKKGSLEKDGYTKMWTDAELVEATIVPIQSNRGSKVFGYKSIAKAFNLNIDKQFEVIEKPKDVERCVSALMADPKFKPQKGKTKRESAYAVCYAQHNKKSCSNEDANPMEVNEMDKETEIKKELPEEPEKGKEGKSLKENLLEKELAEMKEILAKQTEIITKIVKEKEDEEEKKKEDSKDKEEKSIDRQADLKGRFEQVTVTKKPTSIIEKSEYSLSDMLSATLRI